MKFLQGENYASIFVDATKDFHNTWWALIRHRVSEKMDLSKLAKGGYGLRIETKIRVNSAPKRINLHLNTPMTTDFHSQLMEYDIPDTTDWHIISMTLKDFPAEPGDDIYAQMALMDWGPGKYRIDIDYYKVDVVKIDSVGRDLGMPLPYRPFIPKTGTFDMHIPVAQNAVIDKNYRMMNFKDWSLIGKNDTVNVLAVSGTQITILRWDLTEFTGMKADGAGLLELTAHSVQKTASYIKDFGQIRVIEILSGDQDWDQETVTYESLMQGKNVDEVINSQMIIDIDVNTGKTGKTFATISQPVLQRLLEGKTKGIAIRPLGAVNALFYPVSNNIENSPKLHFNIEEN
jgi:hypothetical protein